MRNSTKGGLFKKRKKNLVCRVILCEQPMQSHFDYPVYPLHRFVLLFMFLFFFLHCHKHTSFPLQELVNAQYWQFNRQPCQSVQFRVKNIPQVPPFPSPVDLTVCLYFCCTSTSQMVSHVTPCRYLPFHHLLI